MKGSVPECHRGSICGLARDNTEHIKINKYCIYQFLTLFIFIWWVPEAGAVHYYVATLSRETDGVANVVTPLNCLTL